MSNSYFNCLAFSIHPFKRFHNDFNRFFFGSHSSVVTSYILVYTYIKRKLQICVPLGELILIEHNTFYDARNFHFVGSCKLPNKSRNNNKNAKICAKFQQTFNILKLVTVFGYFLCISYCSLKYLLLFA